MDALCLFERMITSVNWKGACGLRDSAASNVALLKTVFDDRELGLAGAGDDDALMISAACAAMKAAGDGQVENWQHEPAGACNTAFFAHVFQAPHCPQL
jgi:hypothetical protein